MRNDRLEELKQELISIVGRKQVLTDDKSMRFYRKGIRVGNGAACAVIFPKSLLEL